jgi:ABC-2 type transport system ATP-binding protein
MVAGMPMSSPASPILQIDQLGFAYPGEPPLLRGWTTSIGAGLTQLFGDTGSGKSTVLRLLAGDLAGAGQLTLTGVALAQDASAYRRQVFYVAPATRAYDQVSGRACTDQLRQDDPGFDAARWQILVDSFNLAEHIDKPMYMLSTGSKRKVWLAAGLASGRALVLLDEPTGGLDGPSVRALWSALGDLAASSSRAVVVASSEPLTRVPLAATVQLPLAN